MGRSFLGLFLVISGAMDTDGSFQRGAAGKSSHLVCWAFPCGLPQPGSADQGVAPDLFPVCEAAGTAASHDLEGKPHFFAHSHFRH